MEQTTMPEQVSKTESTVDFYATYLAMRLQWRAKHKMDLGNVEMDQIALMTFWNICLSDRVLTEPEYKMIMDAAYDSQDARQKAKEEKSAATV